MDVRSFLRVLLAAALLSCPATLYSQLEELGEAVRIEKIEIKGNSSFSSKRLRSLMKTKGKSLFRPFGKSFLRRDFLRSDAQSIVSFYKTNGFLDAKVVKQEVIYNEKGNGATVVFEIDEGQRFFVGSVALSGVQAIEERRVWKLVDLKVGQPLNLSKIENIRNKILSLYGDEGYMNAAAGVLWERRGELADIAFDVKEGKRVFVGAVSVEGNTSVSEKHVLREMLLKKGDILSRSLLFRSQQRIYDLGYFSDVQFITERKDSLRSEMDLVIKVKEKKMRWTAAAVGYGSTELINLTAEWGNNRVLGTGVRFVGTSRVAFDLEHVLPRPEVRLDYTRMDAGGETSWTFGRRVASRAGVYFEDIERQDVARKTTGFLLSERYDFANKVRTILAYDQRWVNATDSTALKSYVTNSLNLSVERDMRNDLFDPERGSYHQIVEEFAGGVFGGDNSFEKVTATGCWYKTVFKRVVLAGRVKAGVVVPFGKKGPSTAAYPDLYRVPYENRYTLGGATTVRGYREREIGAEGTQAESEGGLALLMANAEIRFPLIGRLGGALFLDSGNVWPDLKQIGWSDFVPLREKSAITIADYRYSAGLGLRLRTPVGPMRVDYGRKLKPIDGHTYQLHASLGQAF
ncbi:MAG: outer membrane protein assembly factor BamA [Candidatus Eisenbacteria bacterium]|nr:outer membrane protein assembly factor BamA [Candidatus Eisenbacteria bacterium]